MGEPLQLDLRDLVARRRKRLRSFLACAVEAREELSSGRLKVGPGWTFETCEALVGSGSVLFARYRTAIFEELVVSFWIEYAETDARKDVMRGKTSEWAQSGTILAQEMTSGFTGGTLRMNVRKPFSEMLRDHIEGCESDLTMISSVDLRRKERTVFGKVARSLRSEVEYLETVVGNIKTR